MQKVLILDANERSSLASTRALGSRGIPIVAAGETKQTLAGSSRYCRETMVYPSPCVDPELFIETIQSESVRRGVKILFPMTELTTCLVLRYRDAFPGIHIPFVPFDAFERLSNKHQLGELARQLGISFPQTRYIESWHNGESIQQAFPFPVVLKPCRSRVFANGRWLATSVQYASSIQELQRIVSKTEYFRDCPFMIQEYIPGHGQGIFALYDHGTPLVFFAHQRLREKPPSGGVSVLSKSIPVDPALQAMATQLLDAARWHGVAMVEFRIAYDGTPYLMEVNCRFWGSLQLAIDAGVDFPWLLYQLATGQPPDRLEPYTIGLKNRWLLGDLDHLYLRIFKNNRDLPSLTSGWQSLFRFLNFFDRDLRYEINRWDDLKPFLFELKKYFAGK